MFCKVCTAIFDVESIHWEEIRDGAWERTGTQRTRHHDTLRDLKTAALEDCFICFHVWRGLLSKIGSNIEKRISASAESDNHIGVLVYWIDTYDDNYKELAFNLIDTENSKERGYVGGFGLYRNEEALRPSARSSGRSGRQVLRKSIAPAISTPRQALPLCLAQSVSQSREWYNECLGQHEECRRASSIKESWRPRRLLRLGASGGCSVVLSKDDRAVQNGAPYATLSYCWGKVEFIKLTAASGAMLEAGIEIVDLPKTFQEAITICRSISIGYIWIDCLCIL